MRKVDDVDANTTLRNLRNLHSRSSAVLQILFLDDDELTVLLHPADRDRVFNLILAWSGQQWRSLQMELQVGHRNNLDRSIKRAIH